MLGLYKSAAITRNECLPNPCRQPIFPAGIDLKRVSQLMDDAVYMSTTEIGSFSFPLQLIAIQILPAQQSAGPPSGAL